MSKLKELQREIDREKEREREQEKGVVSESSPGSAKSQLVVINRR